MIVKTLLVAAAAIGLTGCKPEDIFASDFTKFAKCVDAATKDGHVTAWVAKNACSTKYSTVKSITVNGTGGFAYCLQEMCDSFSMDGRNSSIKTIITEVTIAVNANGRAVTGKLEKLWSERAAPFRAWSPSRRRSTRPTEIRCPGSCGKCAGSTSTRDRRDQPSSNEPNV